MHTVPTRLIPAIGDGHDGDTHVVKAWMGLVMFAGSQQLDNVTAAMLLPKWKHYDGLSPEQAAAVVRRFPRPAVPALPPGVLGQPVAGHTRARHFGGRS
jgi:hypothetical protein